MPYVDHFMMQDKQSDPNKRDVPFDQIRCRKPQSMASLRFDCHVSLSDAQSQLKEYIIAETLISSPLHVFGFVQTSALAYNKVVIVIETINNLSLFSRQKLS